MNQKHATGIDWLETKVCPVCEKHFSVLYPHLWRYKRGTGSNYMYFCKYSCLMEYDRRKEEREVKHITLKEKKRAAEIALSGESPLKYLQSLGVRNPTSTWKTIRTYYEKNDPETYAKLPVSGNVKKPAEKPAEPDPEAEKVELVYDPKIEEEYQTEQAKKAVETLAKYSHEPMEYETTAIRVKGLGEFYFDRKFNSIDWRALDGAETSLTPDGWRHLHDAIPEMLATLHANGEKVAEE